MMGVVRTGGSLRFAPRRRECSPTCNLRRGPAGGRPAAEQDWAAVHRSRVAPCAAVNSDRTQGYRDARYENATAQRGTPRPEPERFEASIGNVHSARAGDASEFYAPQQFAELGVSAPLQTALQAIGIIRPSYIQAAAWKALRSSDRHVLLADHAGSGKTLAYLLPLMQALREEEEAAGGPVTTPNCPRLILLTPTTELCNQVLGVVRALGRHAPVRSLAMTGGHPRRTHEKNLAQGVDVVVATPGRIQELLARDSLRLDRCKAIVLDEVDVLLGEKAEFSEQFAAIRQAAPETTRFVLVTATVSEETYEQLSKEAFPGMKVAFGPRLHRPASGLVEQLVDCSGGAEITEESGVLRKLAGLDRALRQHRAQRTVVFCNKIETCRKVENHLRRSDGDFDVLPYHNAIADDVRPRNLQEFLAPPGLRRQVLVCTDRASRGVDTAHVEHVVLFDFPRDPSEYVRRVGRTARGAGGQGIVSVLVLGRQVGLAKDIMSRNQRGVPIHRVPKQF